MTTAIAPDAWSRCRSDLLRWYRVQGRSLPWRAARGHPADPYVVLVSELMLQQTTVATVRGRFEAFLERFPTLRHLAAAPLDDVLHAWQGLGYYRRARGLHACARAVEAHHGGQIPAERDALLALPGIGSYTAAAIRAIAFDAPALPVDGNVVRVLARMLGLETPLPGLRREVEKRIETWDHGHRPGDVAQALMDLGALVCRPKAPQCDACPWSGACVAARKGDPEHLPRRLPRAQKPMRFGVCFALRADDGRLLFRRRDATGLLAGLHAFPSTPWRPDRPWVLDDALAHAPAPEAWRLVPGSVRHVFTHFVLDLRLAVARTTERPDGLWRLSGETDDLALPTLMRKALRHLADRT